MMLLSEPRERWLDLLRSLRLRTGTFIQLTIPPIMVKMPTGTPIPIAILSELVKPSALGLAVSDETFEGNAVDGGGGGVVDTLGAVEVVLVDKEVLIGTVVYAKNGKGVRVNVSPII